MLRVLLLALLSASALVCYAVVAANEEHASIRDSSITPGPFNFEASCRGYEAYWLLSAGTPRVDDSGRTLDEREIERIRNDATLPRFACLSARLRLDSLGGQSEEEISPNNHSGFGRVWCGPGLSVLLYWEILGGKAPYSVIAAGHQSNPASAEMRIPCAHIQHVHSDGLSSEYRELNIPVRVEDALGAASTVLIPVSVLAPAPSATVASVHVWPGWYDASAIVAPSDWRGGFGAVGLGGIGIEQFGPFVRVALGRYRAVGSHNWTYFDLSVAPRQSAPGFYYPALMTPLEPMTSYEVQGAWIWTLARPHLFEWEQLFEAWRGWTSLEETNWSPSQQFQTGGPGCPITLVAGNSITVLQPTSATPSSVDETTNTECISRRLRVLTWLTSPDWPGVIWAYGRFAPRPSYGEDPDAANAFIAHYAGLPEDSDFVLGFQEPLPTDFRQAPQQKAHVRTASRPIHETAPGVDPRDIEIRVGGNHIIVEWTNQEPYLYGNADLYVSGTTWSHVYSQWHRNESRTMKVFHDLGGQTAFTLYVSLLAKEPLGNGSGYSNMCMIREIAMPPGGPDAYLDRFFVAPTSDQLPTIKPGVTPGVFIDYPYRYHHAGRCRLAFYAYP